ncbi:MAG: cell wall hydrolase [Lachnospiraceae bacterium]|nr:cell wall hydrolase [Lachnospiraceae bacterium]
MKIRKRGGKQRAALLLRLLLAGAMPAAAAITAYATEATRRELEEAKDAKEETESDLNETQQELEELNQQEGALRGELSSLNSRLQEVGDRLGELEDRIEKKEAEIETAQEELEEAKATEEWQYECMKKRIQFMYESRDYVMMEMLFASASFSDFLNRNDYIEQISAYDRRKLEEYRAVKEQVIEKEARLAAEKKELDEYKAQVEEEKSRVSELVRQTVDSLAGKADEIAMAEQEALAYEQRIKEQEEDIAQLQAKLEEEIRLSRLAAQSSWRDISEVSFAEGDRYLLANLIYCEAGGEDYAGQVGVGAVVVNRVLSSVFPDSVVGVIYQSGQFSPVASGRLAAALAENKATEKCYQAADAAMRGETNVGNCVFFRTPIPGLTGISIGGHIFY